ncbi:MAG: RNA polymerase sigma factor [Bacteroidales bacterium]|jgi:RNA polymerase sigma-70 factor (ECF subfamily)|nr:RNA polymerase sigma factor [Bacteroidales bacterium]MDY0196989.1 RNA polymerase sigma factor [Tenuifilaceae bacterium]
MNQMSDKELLCMFRKENTRSYAFNLIVRKYQERLYWHIRKIIVSHDDTDDVIQNTFLKVWNALDGFREDSQLFTWLYRIATNEALTFLKKKRSRFFVPLADVEQQLISTLESSPLLNGDEIKVKLQKAILKLPEKQRLVFNMKYFDELKYEEISGILGTSVGALKASFHHAVKKIEKAMEED